ncbi:MAG: IS481 family transposase, partial [Thermoplasmata archaeon]
MTLTNVQVKKMVMWVVDQGLSTNQAAEDLDVCQRRIQQLTQEYRETGNIPKLKKQGRKKTREYSEELIEQIKKIWKKFRMGAVAIAERLRERHGVKIDNNKVHNVLLENNMARENDNKKGRKKPWVRYERNHSLSAVHMDWHQNKHGKWICAVLDDSSRKI